MSLRAGVTRWAVVTCAVATWLGVSIVGRSYAAIAQSSSHGTIGRARGAGAAGVRDCPPSDEAIRVAIRWEPAMPRAGTLFRVHLAGRQENDAGIRSSISVAGEPLHFRLTGDGLAALAAVPIDSVGGVTLTWRCDDATAKTVRIATDSGTYKLERLRVAPQFGAPPSAALAARMQREADQAAAVSRAAHETPRLWTEPFLVPRPSRITSAFGSGRMFNGAVTSRHMGTDYAGAVGAPIRATNRGVVRLVSAFYLGGNVVYIDHGEGLVSAYLHLSKQRVQVGDTVSRGTVIGDVGATGRVTGPHLHFITRYGRITVDPASVFAQP